MSKHKIFAVLAAAVLLGAFVLGVMLQKHLPQNQTPNPTPAETAPVAVAPVPVETPEVDLNDAHPALERKRAAQQAVATPQPQVTKLSRDIEAAYIPQMTKVSETQFALDFAKAEHCWYLFHLSGVAGKTVRIDLDNVNVNKWWSANPVYRYAKEPPVSFASPLPKNADEATLGAVPGLAAAANGPMMPELAGNGWHYIRDVWSDTPHQNRGDVGQWATVSFVQTFAQDEVDIAFRVPYRLEDEAQLVADVQKDGHAEVVALGSTPAGQEIHVFKLTTGKEAEAKNPGIVLYGREQADTPDTSWVVAGALRRLLLNDAAAQALRAKYNFFFIPILDIDGAARGAHMVLTNDFRNGNPNPHPEASAIAKFFQDYMRGGGRIDVAFNFMNIESAEGDQLLPPLFPPADDPAAAPLRALHNFIRSDLAAHGYRVSGNSWQQGTLPSRLGGWLATNGGGLHMIYEVNAQNQQRHLSTDELQAMGAGILRGLDQFLASDAPHPIIPDRTTATLANYVQSWNAAATKITATNPFSAETRVKSLATQPAP